MVIYVASCLIINVIDCILHELCKKKLFFATNRYKVSTDEKEERN